MGRPGQSCVTSVTDYNEGMKPYHHERRALRKLAPLVFGSDGPDGRMLLRDMYRHLHLSKTSCQRILRGLGTRNAVKIMGRFVEKGPEYDAVVKQLAAESKPRQLRNSPFAMVTVRACLLCGYQTQDLDVLNCPHCIKHGDLQSAFE